MSNANSLMGRTFNVVHYREGYVISEIDEFVARVDKVLGSAEFAGGDTSGLNSLGLDTVLDNTSTLLFGESYDIDEVEAYVAQLRLLAGQEQPVPAHESSAQQLGAHKSLGDTVDLTAAFKAANMLSQLPTMPLSGRKEPDPDPATPSSPPAPVAVGVQSPVEPVVAGELYAGEVVDYDSEGLVLANPRPPVPEGRGLPDILGFLDASSESVNILAKVFYFDPGNKFYAVTAVTAPNSRSPFTIMKVKELGSLEESDQIDILSLVEMQSAIKYVVDGWREADYLYVLDEDTGERFSPISKAAVIPVDEEEKNLIVAFA